MSFEQCITTALIVVPLPLLSSTSPAKLDLVISAKSKLYCFGALITIVCLMLLDFVGVVRTTAECHLIPSYMDGKAGLGIQDIVAICWSENHTLLLWNELVPLETKQFLDAVFVP